MGWECVQHLPDMSPRRPYVSAACATGCRALDSEPRKPPPTQSETGGCSFHTHTPWESWSASRPELPAHTHAHTHTHSMSFHGPDRGAWRAPRKAVCGVSAVTCKQWHSLQVPHRVEADEAHWRRCTFRDMMHEIRAKPLDHRTTSAGIETGEVCLRT